MEPEDTPPMSGSNSICVATVLLETKILPMTEPVTRLTLEAPGGLVEVVARCLEHRVENVAVRNVPSFHDQLDITIEVEGLGTLTADTAYGGDTFVIVDAEQLGFEVAPHEASDIARIGVQITKAANEQVGFHHPDNLWDHFSFCMLTAPLRRENSILLGRNAVSIRPGKIDRSPCGTGCSARMAVLYQRGLLKNGDAFIGESIIGSRFYCTVDGITKTDSGQPAIVPRLRGRAWITGRYQHLLDPADPWPAGYRVADTWPVIC
jgi:proline racemase